MNDIKNFVDDLGIAAFEASVKIAGVAILSDSGNIIFQTDNWDLNNESNNILNIVKGSKSIDLNGATFSVIKTTPDGIIATNESGMGHIIFAPFQGGVLVSYAMAQADTSIALSFLKSYAMRLSGKI